MKKPKASKKKVTHSVKVSKTSKISKEKIKQQQVDWRIWVILGVVVLLIFAVLINILINVNGKVISGMAFANSNDNGGNSENPTYTPTPDPTTTSTTPIVKKADIVEVTDWDTILSQVSWLSGTGINPTIATILQIVFGSPVRVKNVSQSISTAALSAMTLTLCGWLIVFLTFSDIIKSFSSFSKPVAWGIGFALSTILAQFNWQMGFIIMLSKVLNITGSVLVFVSLGAAFASFAVINLGIFPWIKHWAVKRQAVIVGTKIMSKGEKVGDVLEALNTIGDKMLSDTQ